MILGIDLSLNGTGLCLRHEYPEHCLEACRHIGNTRHGFEKAHVQGDYLFTHVQFVKGTKKNPAVATTDYEKWTIIMDTIAALARFVPRDCLPRVIIEDYALHAMGASKSKLCEIGGIVRFWLWKNSYEVRKVNPVHVKMFLGSSKLPKDMIVKEVYKRWTIDLEVNDEADAMVLCKMGEAALGVETGLTAYQVDALKRARMVA